MSIDVNPLKVISWPDYLTDINQYSQKDKTLLLVQPTSHYFSRLRIRLSFNNDGTN